MVRPTFTVWSSEAVATLARGPPKPQCRSVMGRVWRDQTCRGAGVLEESICSTLQEGWIQGEGCPLMPPPPPSGHRVHPTGRTFSGGSLWLLDKPITLVLLTPAHRLAGPSPFLPQDFSTASCRAGPLTLSAEASPG